MRARLGCRYSGTPVATCDELRTAAPTLPPLLCSVGLTVLVTFNKWLLAALEEEEAAEAEVRPAGPLLTLQGATFTPRRSGRNPPRPPHTRCSNIPILAHAGAAAWRHCFASGSRPSRLSLPARAPARPARAPVGWCRAASRRCRLWRWRSSLPRA